MVLANELAQWKTDGVSFICGWTSLLSSLCFVNFYFSEEKYRGHSRYIVRRSRFAVDEIVL